MKYEFNGIAEAAAETADWGLSGRYTQTLLDRDTLDVWTVTHVSENNFCRCDDPAVTVVIGTTKRVSEQRLRKLCEDAMDAWQDVKSHWKEQGCGGRCSSLCYNCPYLNNCADNC